MGGAVKRAVTAESLRRVKPDDVPIKTVAEFINFCKKREENKCTTVTHFELKKDEILAMREEIAKVDPKTVTGTRSFHNFVPLSSSVIGCKRVSSEKDYFLKFDFAEEKKTVTFKLNTFVACAIDNKWHPGFIKQINDEENEIEAIILSSKIIKKNVFYDWPVVENSIYIPFDHVFAEITMAVKKEYMAICNLREVGKAFTIYKKQKKD